LTGRTLRSSFASGAGSIRTARETIRGYSDVRLSWTVDCGTPFTEKGKDVEDDN